MATPGRKGERKPIKTRLKHCTTRGMSDITRDKEEDWPRPKWRLKLKEKGQEKKKKKRAKDRGAKRYGV